MDAHRAALVDGRAQHVHDAAQRGGTDRHHDGAAAVGHHQATAQAVAGAQGNGTDNAVTQLLLDFQSEVGAFELERVINVRHVLARKFHVNHSANALNNLALNAGVRICVFLSHLVLLQ